MKKLDFAADIELFISHKKVLEKYCMYYKDATVAQSMRKVYDLYVMAQNPNDHTLSRLCEMVLLNSVHLKDILPPTNHKHYGNQKIKIDSLLTEAREYLNQSKI